MISRSVRFLPEQHAEEVTLRDSLGHEHRIIAPLVTVKDGVPVKSEPDVQIVQIVQEMELREQIVLEHAAARGHIPPGDSQADGFKDDGCGCG